MTLAFDRLLGLPAHPLLVHLPVFLIPLTAVGAVLCATWATFRRQAGWLVVALALVSVVAIQFTQESGESLERHVRKTHLVEEHAELADALLPIEAGVLVLGAGMMLAERRRSMRTIATSLAVLFALTGVASTVQVARVGHSGAKAVWHDTPTKGRGGSERADGDDG
jgi:uncharacterized membrane protein